MSAFGVQLRLKCLKLVIICLIPIVQNISGVASQEGPEVRDLLERYLFHFRQHFRLLSPALVFPTEMNILLIQH